MRILAGYRPRIDRGGSLRRGVWLTLSIVLTPAAAVADDREVGVELALLVDVSTSVSTDEYFVQTEGIAAALRDPDFGAAIAAQGGIALALWQWSSADRHEAVIPWTLVADAAAGTKLADAVGLLPRAFPAGGTAIGSAIAASTATFTNNGFTAPRQTIDVSGDGWANAVLLTRNARDAEVAAGITVNGLAILSEEDDLAGHYRTVVIGGPGAFVLTAANHLDVARAMRLKLLAEIGAVPAVRRALPGPLTAG